MPPLYMVNVALTGNRKVGTEYVGYRQWWKC